MISEQKVLQNETTAQNKSQKQWARKWYSIKDKIISDKTLLTVKEVH